MTALTPELTERAYQLYRVQGLSASETGAIIGCTRNAVIGRINRIYGALPKPEARARQNRPPAKIAHPPKPHKLKVAVMPTGSGPGPKPEPVTLLDFSRHGCRFPVAYRDGEHWFCNAPGDEGAAYCAGHSKLCYSPRVVKNAERRSA